MSKKKVFNIINFYFRNSYFEIGLPLDVNNLICLFHHNYISEWECSCGCVNDLGVCYSCGQFSNYNYSEKLDDGIKYKNIPFLPDNNKNITGIFNIDYDTFSVAFSGGLIDIYKLSFDGFNIDFVKKTLKIKSTYVDHVSYIGFGLIVTVSVNGKVTFWRFDSNQQKYVTVGKGISDDSLVSSSFCVLAHGVFAYSLTNTGKIKIYGLDEDDGCYLIGTLDGHGNHVTNLKALNNNCFASILFHDKVQFFYRNVLSNKYTCGNCIDEKLVIYVLQLDEDLLCLNYFGITTYGLDQDQKYKYKQNVVKCESRDFLLKIFTDCLLMLLFI